jgi:hypothetical protein
VIEDLEDRILL